MASVDANSEAGSEQIVGVHGVGVGGSARAQHREEGETADDLAEPDVDQRNDSAERGKLIMQGIERPQEAAVAITANSEEAMMPLPCKALKQYDYPS